MNRVRFTVMVAALLAGTNLSAQGATQAGAPTASLTDLLLKQAQTALDAFDRPNAEKFARQVLEQMTTSTPAQKEKARVILANVFYPEEAPAERKRAEALAILKDAVRDNLDLTLDRALSWAGIDSLLAEAKRTTFGLAAGANPQQEGVGPNGFIEFTARASRPSNFRLFVSGPGGVMQISDTTGSSQVTLRVPTMRNERPVFRSASYAIAVVAIDRQTGDSAVMKYAAEVVAPALTFATVPVALDSSRILPERTGKFGWKGIIVGGLVAGGIYSLSNIVHADTAFKTKVGADAKGTGIAAAAGAAVILASFADRGRPIPSAISANRKLHEDFAAAIRNAQAENANRIATHRTQFTITSAGR